MLSTYKEAADKLEDTCWKQKSNQSDTELLKINKNTYNSKNK